MKVARRMSKGLLAAVLSLLLTFGWVSYVEAQGCVQPPSGLVGWWPGDLDALDIVSGFNGTLIGDATFAPGQVDEAFSLDGTGDYVTIPHHPALQPTEITVDAWIKGNLADQLDTTRYLIVDKSHGWTDGTGWALQGDTNSGRIAMVYGNGGFPEVFSSTNVLDGGWHHVAGTLDGSTLKIYVDGVLENSIGYFGSPLGNTRSVNIGASWGGGNFVRFFDGLIDEVEIFNRALNDVEIQAIYNAGSAGKCKALDCVGFQPPLDNGPVSLKKNSRRALPLKAQLFDSDGFLITDVDLAVPPVVQVLFTAVGSPTAVDVTDDALPAGQSSEGNQFFFDSDGNWHFNLGTANYMAPGTYEVSLVSGDESEYLVNSCVAKFWREE